MTSAVKGAVAAVTEGVASAAQTTLGDAEQHYKYVITGGGVGAGEWCNEQLTTTQHSTRNNVH